MALTISPNWSTIATQTASNHTHTWQATSPAVYAFLMYQDKLEPILADPDAKSVRFYLGFKNEGGQQVPKTIVVGVDAAGMDIIIEDEVDSKILNFLLPCPSVCDDGNSPMLHNEFLSNLGPVQTGSTRPIPFSEAVDMTAQWQASQSVRSVLISVNDLAYLFEHYAQAQLRVYFGKDATGVLSAIVVGVNGAGNDSIGTQVYSSTTAVCTTGQSSCAPNSPLFHGD